MTTRQNFQNAKKNSPPDDPLPLPLLLSRADLQKHFGINFSREHLSRLCSKGKFPKPVALGESTRYARKAWRRADIETYVAALQGFQYSKPAA